MDADTILAVDLGRYKSVACVYARATREHTFRAIDTTPDDVGRQLGDTDDLGVHAPRVAVGRAQVLRPAVAEHLVDVAGHAPGAS